MKPSFDSCWNRLVDAARTAPAKDERDESAPVGFATRIAARAMTEPRRASSLFELFSWRALGVAGLLALVCVLADVSLFSTGGSGNAGYDDVMSGDDAVARLLDLS